LIDNIIELNNELNKKKIIIEKNQDSFKNLQDNLSMTKMELNKIKSSLTYKIWQQYCKIRDKFLKRKFK